MVSDKKAFERIEAEKTEAKLPAAIASRDGNPFPLMVWAIMA
jgi:hypothetical protein